MDRTDLEVLERLKAKDRLLFELSDILDAKAGIALVLITYLVGQSSDYLTGQILPVMWWFQVVAVVCLAFAGIAAFASLWPREHLGDPAESLSGWAAAIKAKNQSLADGESAAEREFLAGSVEMLQERIANNGKIGLDKSELVDWAFRGAGIAFALNIFTTISLAF